MPIPAMVAATLVQPDKPLSAFPELEATLL